MRTPSRPSVRRVVPSTPEHWFRINGRGGRRPLAAEAAEEGRERISRQGLVSPALAGGGGGRSLGALGEVSPHFGGGEAAAAFPAARHSGPPRAAGSAGGTFGSAAAAALGFLGCH